MNMDTAHIKDAIDEQQVRTNVQKEVRNVLYIRSAWVNMYVSKLPNRRHPAYPSDVSRNL
jgi:hypothetical protein